MNRITTLIIAALLCVLVPASASAFCGFYVAPGDAKLINNATRVALMRHGDTTVMSMQPDYQGPAEEFAMVLPVPQVLKKKQVKTLKRSLFDTLDNFSSPRMSEYWEQDPCPKPRPKKSSRRYAPSSMPSMAAEKGSGNAPKPYVKIEAQYAVGEYDIVVLSSNDASALETWLVDQKYKIPKNAAPYLAPYINSGSYFFVAKVNPKRAKFEGKNAILSPLRFHFTSKDFTLPIRLGMINSGKEQDIVVFVLGEKRYVPANYPHVPIPTNIIIKDKTRNNFAEFYEGLYAKTRKKNENAIITEYVWEIATVQARGGNQTWGIQNGRKCDPCTSPVSFFTPDWLLALGLDVFGMGKEAQAPVGPNGERLMAKPVVNAPKKLVLTRLHGRFAPGKSNPDIMFQTASPLWGGMGTPNTKGKLEATKFHDNINSFQGRYVILHKWKGKMSCKNPQRGRWGGPPNGSMPTAKAGGGANFGGKKQKSVRPENYAKSGIRYKPKKGIK